MRTRILFPVVTSLLLGTIAEAAETPSYLGSSGVLRTPNASIAAPGSFSYQFNTASDFLHEFSRTNNHVINIGFGNDFELGGRLTDWANDRSERANGTRSGIRDLSGNFKWRIPFSNRVNPDFAVGVFDFAGEAIKLRSVYAVLTHTVANTEVSVGFATGESDRSLDGVFASARVTIANNFHAMVDYANQLPGVGAGFSKNFSGVNLAANVSMDRTDNGELNRAAGLAISVPLERFGKFKRMTPIRKAAIKRQTPSAGKLHSALQEIGFTGITIGKTGKDNVVAFENQVLNQNQLHALAKGLAQAYRYLGSSDNLLVVVKRNGWPLVSLKAPVLALGSFLNNKSSADNFAKVVTVAGAGELIHTLPIIWNPQYSIMDRRHVDVRLQPDLRTTVGSEFGTFDYSLALRADVRVPLPRDFSVLTSYSLPIAKSDLFSKGNTFANAAHEAQINHAVVQKFGAMQQRIPYLASAGYQNVLGNDYLVLRGEASYFPADTSGQLEARAAIHASSDNEVDSEFTGTLGYRHRWQKSGISALIETGQYFAEERGLKLQLSRDFGDSRVTTYINYVDTDDIAGGLQLEVPLTPYKDKVINQHVVVRGSQLWRYRTGTTIKDPIFRGTNRIRPNMMLEPELSHTLSKDYLDSSRASAAYILNNLDLLRSHAD